MHTMILEIISVCVPAYLIISYSCDLWPFRLKMITTMRKQVTDKTDEREAAEAVEKEIMDRTIGRIIAINPRCYPDQNGRDERMEGEVKAVLVEGDVGDYAAYVGIGSDESVARRGDKISFEEACVHFPGGQLKRELYRD